MNTTPKATFYKPFRRSRTHYPQAHAQGLCVSLPEKNIGQGRTGVTFKRAILLPITISSFNRRYENADVKVEVSNGGDLKGSISYAYFRPLSEQKANRPSKRAAQDFSLTLRRPHRSTASESRL
ncbi:hypothetical protein, partial [Pseudomonas syringae]